MATNVAVVPILLLLLEATAAPMGGRRNAPPRVDRKTREWNVIKKTTGQFSTKKDGYAALASELRNSAIGQKFVKQNPVLLNQPKGYHAAPPSLRSQEIEGEGTDRAVIHIRGDNLYIACFTNNIGETFCFNDNQYNSYVIPGSERLPFGSGYNDLVGDGSGAAWKKLIGLQFDKLTINAAVKVISSHRITKTTEADIKALKEAMATMAVFLCESTRFPYIRQLVERSYKGELEVKLDHAGAQLVVQWRRISCAILIWYIDQKRWDHEEAEQLKVPYPEGPGISSIEEALASIRPILYTTACSVPWNTYYNL